MVLRVALLAGGFHTIPGQVPRDGDGIGIGKLPDTVKAWGLIVKPVLRLLENVDLARLCGIGRLRLECSSLTDGSRDDLAVHQPIGFFSGWNAEHHSQLEGQRLGDIDRTGLSRIAADILDHLINDRTSHLYGLSYRKLCSSVLGVSLVNRGTEGAGRGKILIEGRIGIGFEPRAGDLVGGAAAS